ncbi:MAG: hypothetical protein LBE86_08035, partial [Gemmobacter sp.]|nr:hypothetical protein [Gemmobacter sp.]
HLRRARRRTHASRDALVAALAAAGLPVIAPDQGLHLTLPLPDGADDLAFATRARASGFGTRALSPMFLGPSRPGLVIGFSGHPPETLAQAARQWLVAEEGAFRPLLRGWASQFTPEDIFQQMKDGRTDFLGTRTAD